MKRFRAIIALIALLLTTLPVPSALSAQGLCGGASLSDDFSMPSLWTTLGSANSWAGDITINGGTANWNNFGNSENLRVVRDVGLVLAPGSTWRIDWEFTLQNTSGCIGALALGVTSDTAPSRFPSHQQQQETNQNTIEVIVGSPSCTSSPSYFFVSWKHGTSRTQVPVYINFPYNVTVYLRLEKYGEDQCMFGVYSDPARTIPLPNSPACFTIHPAMQDFRYLQMGLWTSSYVARFITCQADNLCIYREFNPDACTATSTGPATVLGLQVYPNPIHNMLNISSSQEVRSLRILSADGKVMMETGGYGQSEVSLDLNPLPAGIYFLEVLGTYENVIKKISKIN